MKQLPSQSVFTAIVPAPFGGIGVRTVAGSLQELVYLPPSFAEMAPADPVAEAAARQVGRYLDDPDWRFELPLMPAGSLFQQRVWGVISSIPRGSVQTYGEVAKALRSAPRAVGQACGANWFPLVIPCHRVTAAAGLGGFSSSGDADGFHVSVKRWLLAHEGITIPAIPVSR